MCHALLNLPKPLAPMERDHLRQLVGAHRVGGHHHRLTHRVQVDDRLPDLQYVCVGHARAIRNGQRPAEWILEYQGSEYVPVYLHMDAWFFKGHSYLKNRACPSCGERGVNGVLQGKKEGWSMTSVT